MRTTRSTATALLILTVLAAATAAHGAPPTAQNLLADPSVRQALETLGQRALAADSEDRRVPAVDRADAFVIGTTLLVGDLDFLSDGTPFRIIALTDRRPIPQNVFVTCLGTAFAIQCGRLVPSRRVSFNGWILVIPDGDHAGLALLIATRVQI